MTSPAFSLWSNHIKTTLIKKRFFCSQSLVREIENLDTSKCEGLGNTMSSIYIYSASSFYIWLLLGYHACPPFFIWSPIMYVEKKIAMENKEMKIYQALMHGLLSFSHSKNDNLHNIKHIEVLNLLYQCIQQALIYRLQARKCEHRGLTLQYLCCHMATHYHVAYACSHHLCLTINMSST